MRCIGDAFDEALDAIRDKVLEVDIERPCAASIAS